MTLDSILGIVMRLAHVGSAIALLGGVVYARMVARQMGNEEASRFRSLATSAIGLLLISGIYNLLHKTSTPSPYHAVFGVKVLLALHVFAVAMLLGKSGVSDEKRWRWMTGITISGFTIVILSAYLRWLSS